jgi:modulator of FtsH protease HflK
MSDRHEHPEHEHAGDAPQAPMPLMPDDAGSKALSDALHSSFWIVKIIMAGLVVLFFASGFFTVAPQERAMKLRFGNPVGEGTAALLGPGAHWAWPYPIDEVVKIPFSEVQSADSGVGWYATTPEQEATHTEQPPGETLNPAADSYVLTGDANIIHVRAKLRYRITDPKRYIFGFTNAPVVVTNVLNNALYFAAAQFNVDDALTRNQTAFRDRIERRIEQVSAQQQLGITVEQVTFTVLPPRQLAERFRAALEASVRSERVMNEAQSYANEASSRAQGDAASRLGVAESDRSALTNQVAAEAKFFSDVLPQYRKNPELFMRSRLASALQIVFTNAVEKKYVRARTDGRPQTLRIDLGREPLKPKAAPEPPKEDHH